MAFEPVSSSDVKNIVNMAHFRGDTFLRAIDFEQSINGNYQAEDLTGCLFEFNAVKVGDPALKKVLSGTTTNGEITFATGPVHGRILIQFDASTASIDAGNYNYDITQIQANGSVRTRIKGLLTVMQNY